jgi:elongator complex protein 2
VSAGEDGCVIVWRHISTDPFHEWTKLCTLNDLSGSIDCLRSLNSVTGILVTASNSKGELVTWMQSHSPGDQGMTKLESIKLPPSQMANSLSLMAAPTAVSGNPDDAGPVLLVVGGVDSRCHLRIFNPFTDSTGSRSFSPSVPVGVLTGHDDWVTCVTEGLLIPGREGQRDLFFATGSQDSKIRMWKVAASAVSSQHAAGAGLNDVVVMEGEAVDEVDDEEEVEGEEAESQQVAAVSEETTGEARCAFMGSTLTPDAKSSVHVYAVSLEALLVGHEDWVTSVHWMPGGSVATPRLFSTSMDRNMVIWEPDSHDGIWIPLTRIGDIGGNLGGSVGGNLLGFVGGCVGTCTDTRGSCSECIIGIGYGGSFHLWQSEGETGLWQPHPFLTGHFGPVMDLVWGGVEAAGSGSGSSEYLLTVSLDQTCRLFAPLSGESRWCEMSRPQIHGYELTCIQLFPSPSPSPSSSASSGFSSLYRMYTGGDEKAIRTFEAPVVVLDGLSKLAGSVQAKELLTQLNGTAEGSKQSRYIMMSHNEPTSPQFTSYDNFVCAAEWPVRISPSWGCPTERPV